ncbi:MAG: deacylase [Acidobacteria bacterium 13_1_40CM_3_55_6]|nr:MAG: deacylase [Acidobacteria bacterium 13_1_40CM_3_55_6]PYS65179.1 MAG: deacylase [Acidobacteriota bacterium]
MPATKLKEFLDSQNVKYVNISHSAAYTAQEIAASAHIPGQELAKTVMVRLDGKLAMAVLPASYKVDLNALKQATRTNQVELAGEQEFRSQFPECELGAMPPFGNLYDLQVYVDQSLTKDDTIAFNAGSHTELIKLSYKDFESLVRPKILKFAALQAGSATSGR